jgi:hypothetical protein
VRDRDHGAGIILQEVLEPFDRLGIEMVGGLVEQQHVRLGQEQPAQRDAALLAAGERADLRVPRRQTQRVGGHFELAFQRVGVVHGEEIFQRLLLGGELVEVGAFLGIGGIDLVQPLLRVEDHRDAFLHHFAHGLVRVELGFLRQIADLDAGLRPRFALEVGVDAGHDAQHRGLARAVQAEQTDLGAGEEAQRDILDDLPLRGNDLAHPVHGVDVLHARFRAVAASRAGARPGWRMKGRPSIIADRPWHRHAAAKARTCVAGTLRFLHGCR